MNIINKGLLSFIILVLIIAGISFLINILPVILIVGSGVWALSYLFKKIKSWNTNRKKVFKKRYNNAEVINNDYIQNFSNGNVIDVEYIEVE